VKYWNRLDDDPTETPEEFGKWWSTTVRAYRSQLRKLQPRLSQAAWRYFWNGFGRWGLHDATLLSFTLTDCLGCDAGQIRLNSRRAAVRMQFVNYEGDLLYTFTYRELKKVWVDWDAASRAPIFYELNGDEPLIKTGFFLEHNRVDLLHADELTAVDRKYLRHEFLFFSGANLGVEFAKLSFRRQRIKRRRSV